MSNNGILDHNIGFDCHNCSNCINMDCNTSQSVDAWHSQGWASQADCVNYIMQVTGSNASEAKFKCEKVIPHTPFTGDLNVSNKSS